MAEPAEAPGPTGRADDDRPVDDRLSVVADDLHLTYELFTEGARPSIRQLVTRTRVARPRREVHAVRGVSFAVRRGEAIGLIGRNGSGKSSLSRLIAGLIPPTRGAVYASGDPILLGVNAALNPKLSGRRNVFLGGTALGIERAVLEESYDDIVDFTGLHEFMDMPIRAYSSGMRARLQFAISTVVAPEILVIDEALAVGDAEFKRSSEERIRQLTEDAGTIFLVSHSQRSIRTTCSRALWLDAGRLMADGPVDDVMDAYLAATAPQRTHRRPRKKGAKVAKKRTAKAAGQAVPAAADAPRPAPRTAPRPPKQVARAVTTGGPARTSVAGVPDDRPVRWPPTDRGDGSRPEDAGGPGREVRPSDGRVPPTAEPER